MKISVRFKDIILFFVLPFTFFACSEVRLIGAYDNKVDDNIQSISKDISNLFIQIDKNIDDGSDWSFKSFKKEYIDIETELNTLKIRVGSLPKYKIINEQVVALDSNIIALEKHHQSGFVAPGINDKSVLKKVIKIDQSGIETQLSAMLSLQEGLKRTKTDKPKGN